jgi:hypothetical protein
VTIDIFPVLTEIDNKAFYQFGFKVYRSDPNWVPPLWPQRKEYLDKKAAFFSYGEGDFWLAKDGAEIVGTIGTAVNLARNRDKGWKAGTFEANPQTNKLAKRLGAYVYRRYREYRIKV